MRRARPLPSVFCFTARSPDHATALAAAQIVRKTLTGLGMKVEGPDALAAEEGWRDPHFPFGPFVPRKVHRMRLRIEGLHEELLRILEETQLPSTVLTELSAFDHRAEALARAPTQSAPGLAPRGLRPRKAGSPS